MLDAAGLKHQLYELPSHLDITSCFIEGDKDGELLLDFLTETLDFAKTAPPELKHQLMEELRKPGCSEIRDGKVFFNNNLSVIVIEPWVNFFCLIQGKEIQTVNSSNAFLYLL